MLKKIICGLFIGIFILSVIPAIGQEMPHGKWWDIPRVSKQLNLSEAEKDQLDELFLESRRKFIDLKGAIEKERLDLEALMESDDLDEEAVMAQFKKVEAARADLSTEFFSFIIEVRKILGAERFKQLKVAFKEGVKKMKGRFHKKGLGDMDRPCPFKGYTG